MSRSRISQWLGMSRLKFEPPLRPSRDRLNQQVPQQSEPPLGIRTLELVDEKQPL